MSKANEEVLFLLADAVRADLEISPWGERSDITEIQVLRCLDTERANPYPGTYEALMHFDKWCEQAVTGDHDVYPFDLLIELVRKGQS